jgi:hypothetical protein
MVEHCTEDAGIHIRLMDGTYSTHGRDMFTLCNYYLTNKVSSKAIGINGVAHNGRGLRCKRSSLY